MQHLRNDGDRRRPAARRAGSLGALCSALLILGACTTAADDAVSDEPTIDATADATQADAPGDAAADGETPPGELALEDGTAADGTATDGSTTDDAVVAEDPVSDDGVLDAVIILLADGDIEAALAAGDVSEAEVAAALEALASGDLERYLD